MSFEELIHYSGYLALLVLLILFAGNVGIVGARLFHRFRTADFIIHYLEPASDLFRLGTSQDGPIGRHSA